MAAVERGLPSWGGGQGTACSFPDALGGPSEEGMAAPTRVTPGLGSVQSGTL